MPAVNLSPIGNGFQFFTDAGLPLNAGLLWTYAAGTTTPTTTYTDSGGTIANSNPIVLGPDGRLPSELWLTVGTGYKLVLLDSLSNPIDAWDNILGIGDFNNLVLAGNLTVNGNTTLGNAAADTLTIASANVTWSGNPTHSGSHTFSGTLTENSTSALLGGATFINVDIVSATLLDYYLEAEPAKPTLTFGGAAVGIAYNINRAVTYTRIGNRVFGELRMKLTSKGASVGAALISGLPFALTGTVTEAVCAVDYSGMGGLTGTLLGIITGTTIALVQTGAAATAAVTDAAFTNTADLFISFQYKAA